MKKQLLIISILLPFLTGCTVLYSNIFGPKSNFKYNGEYAGIDSLIFVNGYFQSLDVVDDPYGDRHRGLMFYPNGLSCRSISDNLSFVFSEKVEGNPFYLSWGNYAISNDTIKVQFFINTGWERGIVVVHCNYLIKSFEEIEELSKDLGPNRIYTFHPLENRIDSTNWLLKKKWFYKKDK